MGRSLSIVIPVYRESEAIGPCLEHLRDCADLKQCEVIVVDGDGGSTRTPGDIVPLQVVDSAPGRGIQLNAGAGVATSDYLLFLHVDTILPTDFVHRVCDALGRFSAGAFDLHIVTRNPITAVIGATGRLRSRLTRIPYGDQAQFIRADLFDEIGGFPDEPLMEDVALMDRIKAAGHEITFLRPPARTSDRRWRREGAVRGTLRNWQLIRAYRRGVKPTDLVSRYKPEDHGQQRVILFYRALREGGVKTRLAAELGDSAALALYAAMLADCRTALEPIAEIVAPYIDNPAAGSDYFGNGRTQRGPTLEKRMERAFRESFRGGALKTVLVGSDIPGLGATRIREALSALEDHDAVIAPSSGGGYYLIGFRRDAYIPLLSGAGPADSRTGSAEDPFEIVVGAMREAGMSWAKLSEMRDVDTAADLEEIYRNPQGMHPNLDRVVAETAPHLRVNQSIVSDNHPRLRYTAGKE